MVSEKNIDPRKIIIMIIAIILALIIKNLIIGTLCIEEYQIAECPNNLYLDSYYINAENEEDANNQIKIILDENNISLDDYEIKIENNIIKIIEKEKQEIKKEEQAGQKNEETEETTKQENNLEIKNENIEFNNENNNEIEKISGGGMIPFTYTIIIYFKEDTMNFKIAEELKTGDKIELLFTEIQNSIDNNYQNKIVEWKLKDENGNELTGEEIIGQDIVIKAGDTLKLDVEITKITNKETEEGGTINNADIKELKEIDMCICVLLAIMFIYNFTNSMLKRY